MDVDTSTRLARQNSGGRGTNPGLTELAIECADAIVAGRLRWDHRDPFDRMIVAQAARRDLCRNPFLSMETAPADSPSRTRHTVSRLLFHRIVQSLEK